VLRVVDDIQSHSKPIILSAYRGFLLENHDPEVREYPDDIDQIREVLIHENYFSRRDIDFCLEFDVVALNAEPTFAQIQSMHSSL
jgi:hypothetical protein